MDKNRRNRLRRIVIDREIYFWIVSDHNFDGDGGDRLKIWRDKEKIYCESSHTESITPKIVREKIIELNKK